MSFSVSDGSSSSGISTSSSGVSSSSAGGSSAGSSLTPELVLPAVTGAFDESVGAFVSELLEEESLVPALLDDPDDPVVPPAVDPVVPPVVPPDVPPAAVPAPVPAPA